MLLAARAATLVLVARRAQRLEELRVELAARHPRPRVVIEAGDLSDEAEVERVVAAVLPQVDGVDVLVNNAGVGTRCCSTERNGAALGRCWPPTCSRSCS